MLQSVSAHLMDERRLSRLPSDNRGGSRYSRRATLADALGGTHLCPPHWYGIGVIEDFQPSILTPSDSSLGWAMFNTLPIRPPSQRLRNRHVGMCARVFPRFCRRINVHSCIISWKYRQRGRLKDSGSSLKLHECAAALELAPEKKRCRTHCDARG